MSGSTHDEIRKYFNQIVGPKAIGFKLKEALPVLREATRIAENRLKKIWSGHCLVTADEYRTLQEAALRAEERRRIENENRLLAEAKGIPSAREPDPEPFLALLQDAEARLAALGEDEAAARIRRQISSLRRADGRDDGLGRVLGRQA